jgi:small subunit ribosomal protein S18
MAKERESKGKGKGKGIKKKYCKLCLEKVAFVDYKDEKRLGRFVTDRGKIVPRRVSGTCSMHQKQLTTAIKRARVLALLPFTSDFYR